MKISSLVAAVVLGLLLTAPFSHAAQKPQLFGVQSNAYSVEISPDGKLLMANCQGSPNHSHQIWDIATRRSLWGIKSNWTFFSSNSRFVASVDLGTKGSSLKVNLLNARTGRLVRSLKDPSHPGALSESDAFDAIFSPGCREFYLATRSSLRRWDVATGRLLGTKPWTSASARITNIEEGLFSPGGQVFLARRYPEDTDMVFDARTAQGLRTGKPSIYGAYGFSPNGHLLWMAEEDGPLVDVFRMNDDKLLWKTTEQPIFSPDGRVAYVHTSTGFDVLDAQTGRKVGHLTGPKEFDVVPSPDGNCLYEVHDGKIFRWWIS